MLSDSSYMTAIYTYVGAAVAIVLLLALWLGRSWRPAWATLVVLLAAVLLLTPAYPREGVDTLAPALVVAGFQFLTAGLPAAEHAIRPLVLFGGGAVLLSLLLGFTVFRRRPPQDDNDGGAQPAAGASAAGVEPAS